MTLSGWTVVVVVVVVIVDVVVVVVVIADVVVQSHLPFRCVCTYLDFCPATTYPPQARI